MPPALTLAHQLAPRLAHLHWAIGGTTMLFARGVIENAPRDLDTFTTHDDFDAVCDILTATLGPGVRPPSGNYASDRFITFTASTGVEMDVMAGAGALKNGVRETWLFDPTHVERVDGLPLMSLTDWLALYRLFDRPQRVEQIENYLRRNASQAHA